MNLFELSILIEFQNNFCEEICDNIFDKDKKHIWNKWLKSDNNLLVFMSLLDDVNRKVLFDYIMSFIEM